MELIWKSVYLVTGYSLGRAQYTMDKGAQGAFGVVSSVLFFFFLLNVYVSSYIVAAVLFAGITVFLLAGCSLVEETEEHDAQKKRML